MKQLSGCSIALSQGKFAIVSEHDYSRLNEHKWSFHKGYAVRSVYTGGKGKQVYMHREVLNIGAGLFCDHINRDTLNNTRENLRVCTTQQNAFNRRFTRKTASGLKGVGIYSGRRKKYRAMITVNNKQILLGYFRASIEAARVYDLAAKKYHGEFALLNFPERT